MTMIFPWKPASGLLAAALLLAGCASPGPQAPVAPLLQASEQGAVGSDTVWPETQWWRAYGDAGMNALIERALAGQPALQAVQARLRAAQAAVDASRATGSPQVGAQASLIDQRYSENGLFPPPLAGSIGWNNNAQIGASWEMDLFGRQRAQLDAALGTLRASQAEARAAEVLLAGQVATAHVELARLVEVESVAQDAQRQREQVLALVRQRITAGLDTNVELRQAETLVAQSQVELLVLDEAMARQRRVLAELSGQAPGACDGLRPVLAPLQSMALPEVLPADLLGRRADLVAQRWRVEAALRGIDDARAQFHPNVSLTAFVGLASLGLDRFIQAGSLTYGAGPALSLPIFDGGRLRAQLGVRSAEADAAIAGYNGALLRALHEVADEIGALRSVERQQQAQRSATEAAESAFTLALQRYQAGLGNFLTVLNAQTQVLAQRRAGTDLKARHLAGEIALNRALGGGYRSEDLPPSTLAASGAPSSQDSQGKP